MYINDNFRRFIKIKQIFPAISHFVRKAAHAYVDYYARS